MKNILNTAVVLVIVFLIASNAVFAHSGTDDGTGFGMMRSLEDQALGGELHEEMEGLMVKMMSGALSVAEANRMVELMDEYPGPQAMMMGRMMGMQYENNQIEQSRGATMMPGYGAGLSELWLWLFALVYAVWLVVGVLAAVWLWQRIIKK